MSFFPRGLAIVLTIMLGFAGAAQAQAQAPQSQVVFSHKKWEVRVVGFDDGSLACVARVEKPGSSFSIWGDAFGAVQLQFYATAWRFNDETADIVVQIDRRAKWDLTNAELDQNSILFNLPDGDASIRFVKEVARGNQIKLFNKSGKLVESWSLAGSSASINALIDCTNLLKSEADGDQNPFN